jgi:hypothetical protein
MVYPVAVTLSCAANLEIPGMAERRDGTIKTSKAGVVTREDRLRAINIHGIRLSFLPMLRRFDLWGFGPDWLKSPKPEPTNQQYLAQRPLHPTTRF